MPPRLVSDDELLDRLTELFRREGFAGASLAGIAAATGLQKSSLYHRFPGGKEQMAAEVARSVGVRFATHVLAPLRGEQPLAERIVAVARNLDRFYDGGARSCVLDMLSSERAGSATAEHLAAAAAAWVAAFAGAARESGADDAEALLRAERAVVAIEGSLVLARVTGDKAPFARAIAHLPSMLIDPRSGAAS